MRGRAVPSSISRGCPVLQSGSHEWNAAVWLLVVVSHRSLLVFVFRMGSSRGPALGVSSSGGGLGRAGSDVVCGVPPYGV